MKENRRCSILFHLLVPGGKWHTEIGRRRGAARFCSSTFHNRTRAPLLPPAAAVIRNRGGRGEGRGPILSPQRRILATANAAVSWSMPTLTQPVLAPRS